MVRSRGWEGGLSLAVDIVWWLSVAAAGVGAALLVVVGTHVAGGGALKLDFYFQLPASAYRISSARLGASAATVGISGGQLSFASPRLSFVLVSAAGLAVVAGGWLFSLHQLRRLLAALRAGETFDGQNAIRLRRIGLAVIVFELGHAVAVWGGGLYLRHVLVARGLSVLPHFGVDIPVLLLGLLLIALAGAFRVGAELADEQALTV